MWDYTFLFTDLGTKAQKAKYFAQKFHSKQGSQSLKSCFPGWGSTVHPQVPLPIATLKKMCPRDLWHSHTLPQAELSKQWTHPWIFKEPHRDKGFFLPEKDQVASWVCLEIGPGLKSFQSHVSHTHQYALAPGQYSSGVVLSQEGINPFLYQILPSTCYTGWFFLLSLNETLIPFAMYIMLSYVLHIIPSLYFLNMGGGSETDSKSPIMSKTLWLLG